MNNFLFGKCAVINVAKGTNYYIAQAYSKVPNETGQMENVRLNIFIAPEIMEWRDLKGTQPKMDMVQKGKSIAVSGTTVHETAPNGELIFNVLVNNRRGLEFPKKSYGVIAKLIDVDITGSQPMQMPDGRCLNFGQYSNKDKVFNIMVAYEINQTSRLIKKGKSANFSGKVLIKRNSKGIPYLMVEAETAVADRKLSGKYVRLEGLNSGKKREIQEDGQ